MAYSREIYDAALARLGQSRLEAEQEAERRRSAFYRQFPRAWEIDRTLSTTAVQAAKAVLSGADAAGQLQKLRDQSLALQQERTALLARAGLPENGLEPQYRCPACGDTGYIDGRMCSCLRSQLKQEAYRQLNASTPLSLCTFDSFSLQYYPDAPEREGGVAPRAQMARIFKFCREYARDFSLRAPSLILQGGTGLGKTHLSLAIANEAIQKGFGVVYGSTQNLATRLERERFSRDGDEGDTNELLIHCDLLILDDLGTEFSTSFVDAAIYNIINTRLLVRRPTIISTNLTHRELQKRYSERMTSRIIGSYTRLLFCGKDVRQQKRLHGR